MSRVPTAAPLQEPSTTIARALHQRLPERIRGAGTLCLWLRSGLALSEQEAEDTRALFLPGGEAPLLSDFARMTTLRALNVLGRSGWILDQIAEDRFTSYFHPIVHADDTSRTFAYEALLRGVERDGSLVDPEESLRALVRAIDDAGMPHDRIVYFIKLDRELIDGVHLDPVKGLIAGKLLEIGRGLGIGTIVEGIELPEELDWVRQHGADYVQGFLIGRPCVEPLRAVGA